MEDGVSENENLVNSMAVSPKERLKKMELEDCAYTSNDTNVDEEVDGVEVEEEEAKKAGGYISNLISNLVSPTSRKARSEVDNGGKDGFFGVDVERSSDIEEGSGVVSGDGDARMFNNLVSSIFHSAVEDKGRESERDASGVAQGSETEEDKEKDANGGIIDNIVSRLPHPPFPDDAAPTANEASILLHSVVHD